MVECDKNPGGEDRILGLSIPRCDLFVLFWVFFNAEG